MSRRGKLTDEEKVSAVQEYLDGKGSYNTIAKKYGLVITTMRDMVSRVRSEGIRIVCSKSSNKKHNKETKIKAVEEYLKGKRSLTDICVKYHI